MWIICCIHIKQLRITFHPGGNLAGRDGLAVFAGIELLRVDLLCYLCECERMAALADYLLNGFVQLHRAFGDDGLFNVIIGILLAPAFIQQIDERTSGFCLVDAQLLQIPLCLLSLFGREAIIFALEFITCLVFIL